MKLVTFKGRVDGTPSIGVTFPDTGDTFIHNVSVEVSNERAKELSEHADYKFSVVDAEPKSNDAPKGKEK